MISHNLPICCCFMYGSLHWHSMAVRLCRRLQLCLLQLLAWPVEVYLAEINLFAPLLVLLHAACFQPRVKCFAVKKCSSMSSMRSASSLALPQA
jgi:hypothetical protein